MPGDLDFGNDPVVFGTRWEEGEDGECIIDGPLVLAHFQLTLKFINTAVGDPLPDIIDLIVFPLEGQESLELSMHAVAFGELEDGTHAVAGTDQKSVDENENGTIIDDDFITEHVYLVPLPDDD